MKHTVPAVVLGGVIFPRGKFTLINKPDHSIRFPFQLTHYDYKVIKTHLYGVIGDTGIL